LKYRSLPFSTVGIRTLYLRPSR